MKNSTTHEYLVKLRDTIIQERECAKKLDMAGFEQAVKQKEELINVLSHVKVLSDDDRAVADQIKAENRRNAFLFKSTLGWIRQTMEFFGKKTVTATYGSSAQTVAAHVNGRLLSGRV